MILFDIAWMVKNGSFVLTLYPLGIDKENKPLVGNSGVLQHGSYKHPAIVILGVFNEELDNVETTGIAYWAACGIARNRQHWNLPLLTIW